MGEIRTKRCGDTGGLAILENAYHQTAKLEAVPVSASDLPAFFRHEARLHSEAKALMPRLPLPMSAWKPTTVDPAITTTTTFIDPRALLPSSHF